MAKSLVIFYSKRKQDLTRALSYASDMRNINRRPMLQILSDGVRYLMDLQSLNQTSLAGRGVSSQKTISNVLNQVGWPTLKTLAEIAAYFKIPEWMLLADIRDLELLHDRRYADAVESLANCDPETREYLYSVIKREADRSSLPVSRSNLALPAPDTAPMH